MTLSRNRSLSATIRRCVAAAVAASVLSVSLIGCSLLKSFQDEPGSAQVSNTGSSSGAEKSASEKMKALERWVDVQNKDIPAFLASADGSVYADSSIVARAPDTAVFIYVYKEHVEPSLVKDFFDGKISYFQDQCDTGAFPSMAVVGVTGSKHVIFSYQNVDGSTVWEHDFAYTGTE